MPRTIACSPQAVDRIWRATTDKPLRFVGSYTNVVNGVSFYLPSRPSTLEINEPAVTPWADPESVARAGIALVCPEPETVCMDNPERARARPAAPCRHAVAPPFRRRRHAGALRDRDRAADLPAATA